MQLFGCNHTWTDWEDHGETGPVVTGVSATGAYQVTYHRLSRHCSTCGKRQSTYIGYPAAMDNLEAPRKEIPIWRRVMRR